MPARKGLRAGKVVPSAVFPKIWDRVCAESSVLSIAFFARSDYNQTIDSNGAVGHLLTRSAIFVKKLFVLWVLHCGRPKAAQESKIK